jgi:hypothetical protein
VGRSEGPSAKLSSEQRASILELGSRGSGGEFNTHVMSGLMTMGFVAVETKTRCLVLTKAGRAVYAELLQRLPG